MFLFLLVVFTLLWTFGVVNVAPCYIVAIILNTRTGESNDKYYRISYSICRLILQSDNTVYMVNTNPSVCIQLFQTFELWWLLLLMFRPPYKESYYYYRNPFFYRDPYNREGETLIVERRGLSSRQDLAIRRVGRAPVKAPQSYNIIV